MHGLDLDVVSGKAVDGTLTIKAHNAPDQEIGRAQVALKQGADEARHVRVLFDERVELRSITMVGIDFVASSAQSLATK